MPNQTYLQQLTSLSRNAFDAASSLNISAREAVSVLAGIPVRTFSDLLTRFAPEGFSKEDLVNGLCADDAGRVRASIDKKVRGWLGGKNQPTAREDLLELCFVLRLKPEQADAFLLALGGEGIHWRDPKELTAAFALRAGMDYPAWLALLDRVQPQDARKAWDADTDTFTATAAEAFPALTSEQDLKAFLEENQSLLGSFHRKARLFFNEYLRVLEQPGSADGEDSAEESYTSRRIVETYLNRKLPDTAGANRTDSLRRGVLSGWPDETALSRMKTGKADITRKVLILLFLATDGGEEAPAWSDENAEDDWDDSWEEDPFAAENDADEAFESSLLRINSMLSECGFQMLDPRAPFDWIAIYCMRVGDDPEEMAGLTERLSQMMNALFSPEDT